MAVGSPVSHNPVVGRPSSPGHAGAYLIAANELAFTCDMAAYPRIWDITDEATRSSSVSSTCPAADNCSGTHYNDVDDRENTTMALVGSTDAGFRIFDVRDPVHPRPFAFFKPGSGCYSVAHLDQTTRLRLVHVQGRVLRRRPLTPRRVPPWAFGPDGRTHRRV